MAIGQFMPMVWSGSGRTPDPYWSYVVAALHMDAFDSSGMPVDVSPLAKTYSRGGLPILDASNKIFGDASYAFSGTGQYFYTPTRAELILPANGNFTVEGWMRFQTGPVSRIYICSHKTSWDWTEPELYLSATSKRIILDVDNAIRVQSPVGGLNENQWYHVSYGRSNGNRLFLYLDGILIGTYTNNRKWDGMSLTIASAGSARDNSNGDKFRGTLDEFRWWNGVSIRDGINNFIPPTAPWADY